MIEPTTERGRKLASVARQLRVLHDELVDQPADIRSEQLRDYVRREVSTISPHEREDFVGSLRELFPVWSASSAPSQPSRPPAAPAPSVQEPMDPMAMADLLIKAAASLKPSERATLAAKLAEAGLVTASPSKVETREVVKEVVREVHSGGPMPEPIATELRKIVGLPADVPPKAERAVELCALMADFVTSLELYGARFWHDIGKDTKTQFFRVLTKERPNERQGLLARYLEGDPALSRETLAKELKRVRLHVSYIILGVVNAGKQFSRDHMSRFSVDALQAAAEKATFTEGQASKNWKQYVRLMEGVDEAALEKRLLGLIAKDVDAQLSTQVVR